MFQKIKIKVIGNVKEHSKVQAISTRVNETRASEVRSMLKKVEASMSRVVDRDSREPQSAKSIERGNLKQKLKLVENVLLPQNREPF